jgi:branched-chain amino acid transport system permease protein
MAGVTVTSTITAVYCITAAVLLLLWFIDENRTGTGQGSLPGHGRRRCHNRSHRIVSITSSSARPSQRCRSWWAFTSTGLSDHGAIPAYKTVALIVVGGLGSVPGAVVASLLLGMAETLLIGYANIPLPRDALAFIAMIGVLMWRSQGLLGSR